MTPDTPAMDEKGQALKDIEACLDEAVSYLVDLAGAKPDRHSPHNCRLKIDEARFYARHLASLKASQEAEVVKAAVWRVTLLPDDRTIKDDLIFTFVHKAEFEAFCNGCRANQSAWSITDICEYQASTAARALDAIAHAIPGEDDDTGSCLATPQPSPGAEGDKP